MRHGRAEWENHATKARHDHHHMCLKKKSTNNGKKKDPKKEALSNISPPSSGKSNPTEPPGQLRAESRRRTPVHPGAVTPVPPPVRP